MTVYFRGLIILLILLGGLGPLGCKQDKPWTSPDPKDAFRAFLLHWTIGKDEQVLAALAPSDREVLSKTQAKLIESLGKEHAPSLSALFFASGVSRTFDLKKVELVAALPDEVKAGTRSELKIFFHDGREGAATMVWDGSRWCVLLGLKTG